MLNKFKEIFDERFEELGYDIAWQNLIFTQSQLDTFRQNRKHYLRVDYLWARAEKLTLGCGRQPGIIQCSVYTKLGTGSKESDTIIQEVLDKFPMNYSVKNNDIEVRIDNYPYPSNGIPDNGWYFVPISIPVEFSI